MKLELRDNMPVLFKYSWFSMMFGAGIIMGASKLSALSGVGKGIKWLPNLNMGLSILLLAFLKGFGSTGSADDLSCDVGRLCGLDRQHEQCGG